MVHPIYVEHHPVVGGCVNDLMHTRNQLVVLLPPSSDDHCRFHKAVFPLAPTEDAMAMVKTFFMHHQSVLLL
jgi:hypothetical protein